jgi:hypothetical protein
MTFFIIVDHSESISDYLDRKCPACIFHSDTESAAECLDPDIPQSLYRVEITDAGLTKKQLDTLRRSANDDTRRV